MNIEKLLECLMIYIIIFVTNSVLSEWIDIPQFSDVTKVYRVPFTKSHRHQIPFDRLFNSAESTLSNTSEDMKDQLKETMQVPIGVNVDTTTLAYTAMNADDIEEYTEVQELVTISNDSLPNNPNTKNNSTTPILQILRDYCDRETGILSGNATTIEDCKWTFIGAEKSSTEPLSFLENVPIELVRRVHTILLGSTLTAIRDKQDFLRKFRKSILRKLESGLTPVFNSVRKKRGSIWDDQHEHIGFPSLEGALLAISFLTFAVYLVQLVMMLLRNLASNGTPNPSTVLVNRNKRSVSQFSDDSARILEYLERFSNNQ